MAEEELLQYKIALAVLWHIHKGHSIREMLPDLLEYGDTTDIVRTLEGLQRFGYITEHQKLPSPRLTVKAEPILNNILGNEHLLQA